MGFKLTVEVPLFLAIFACYLTDKVTTNLLIYRTCYIILDLDPYNCSLLGNTDNNITSELEKIVQPKADVINMIKSSVESVSAALICMFVGVWSDRFGRKPVIIANLIGFTSLMILMLIFSAIKTASPWYMMTFSIPIILTGGQTTLLMIALAYVTDITTKEHRGVRILFLEGFLGTAILVGTSSSSFVFNATSYVVVYLLGALSCILGLLYTIFFMSESLENKETENRVKGMFEIQNVSGLFKTTFKKRPQYDRAIILLIIFALALYFVALSGDGSVMFLFMRAKFHWTLQQFTLYDSMTSIILVIGGTIIVYKLHFKLKVRESVIIFIGFIVMMLGMILQGLAEVDWLIYVASVVKIPSANISPMTKSLISKSVNGDEVAKIFSVFIILQTLLGLVGSPIYTTLYNSTLETNPGIFNFVTAGEHAVNAMCLLAVLILQRKSVSEDYASMETNPLEVDENSTSTITDTVAQDNSVENC